MKNNLYYKIAIIVLILLNLLQVGAKFLSHRPPQDPIKKAVGHLKLNVTQEEQFKVLAEEHRNTMIDLQQKQDEIIESYFKQSSDSLLDMITVIERKKIQITDHHFNSIKSILNKSQYVDFEFFKKMSIKKILRVKPSIK